MARARGAGAGVATIDPGREWRASGAARARPGSGKEQARRFHEEWLGYVQPKDGLVFSIPVLIDAECHDRNPPALQQKLRRLAPRGRAASFDALLTELLGFAPGDFDGEAAIPDALSLAVAEGPQLLRPTRALRRRSPAGVSPPVNVATVTASSEAGPGLIPDATTPAARAGADYLALIWELPEAVTDLDRPESVTGAWAYAPSAKLERLMRACQIPIGLLTNGQALRLIYAPHGGAAGSLTFNLPDMVQPGAEARSLLDAFYNLLSAQRFFAVAEDRQLPALLAASRTRQADVTTKLAGQLQEALSTLLDGFGQAAERHGPEWLGPLLAEDRDSQVPDNAVGDSPIYEGLLTVLLRLVFILYAEDKGLLPVERRLYDGHYGLHALYDQLQDDHARHADTMNRRFGAWSRLLALFRAVHGGAHHAELGIPARHGDVFNPRRFPFLERVPGGRAPTIDDGSVHRVLRQLLMLDGQRLSYRALDVEQLGSVYEGLMGFRVVALAAPAVCLRGNRVWVVARDVLAGEKANRRSAYLEDDLGVDKAVVKKLGPALEKARTEAELLAVLETQQATYTARRQAGRLVLQPTLERRRTSAHYTPRELTDRVVRRALEPLLGAMGAPGMRRLLNPGSEQLLSLKICDPAMGSGAFLVAACRFLGEQVVAAWTREGNTAQVGNAAEDAGLRAKRLVAQRCLYGVDKNPLAVNLAKLSLWLETMARDEPFTFVDHALRTGDSLVGLTNAQIGRFDWTTGAGTQLALDFGPDIEAAVKEALALRTQILELARTPGARATEEKESLLKDCEDALARTRLVADVLVGAWFSCDSDKDRERERLRRHDLVLAWLREGGEATPELQAFAATQRRSIRPFHWELELPEIFVAGRRDPLDQGRTNRGAWMDSFVGNPPFAGKNGIGELHPAYLPWVQHLHAGAHGNADLCAHFFLRTHILLGEHGTLGLVATNTIAQGDTRATGLRAIVASGGIIYDAVKSMPWPGDAAVAVSLVHVAKGRLAEVSGLETRLDGLPVREINSRLLEGAERPDPQPLRANEGQCYQGAIVLGMGFTLTPDERKELIRRDPANGKLIFPYLGGEEVNTSPTQTFHRYVINFGERSLEEAKQWPDLYEIVKNRVKPERDKNGREGYRRYWWQYAEKRAELSAQLRSHDRCLVTCRVTKHLCFSFQPTNRVFAETTYVLTFEDDAHFAVLQSRIHEPWARLLSSSMRNDLRYAASDCFDTFPFPPAKQFADGGGLAGLGRRLYDARAKLMAEREQGLTTTYNQLKDSTNQDAAIRGLRKLHEEMDRAVLAAYGWNDLEVPAFTTPITLAEKAVLERFNAAVIDRLFALNADRAAAEGTAAVPLPGSASAAGLSDPRKPAHRAPPSVRTGKAGKNRKAVA